MNEMTKLMSETNYTYLKDYTPCSYAIKHTELLVELYEDQTLVTASLHCAKNQSESNEPLKLNGDNLKLLAIELDGHAVDDYFYHHDKSGLTVYDLPETFILKTTVEIHPEQNTTLEGLYRTRGIFCTQCEAHGFRKITYYLDRPDVMASFDVTITADRDRYPVLLSNGNLIETGYLNDNRHYAKWHDPYKKPSYLFGLVAGQLAKLSDQYQTRSQRTIQLAIYAMDKDTHKCHYALQFLKQAMQWDEKRFGLECDLDQFMIVAVPDFNSGAMENKGLNIFNTRFVLAGESTVTDYDYETVQAVIGHEYFHNWTGNRVTCRDWFQLSLKEGLTVFREQEFASDFNDPYVNRIHNAKLIQQLQFAEDASPMAHPVRPNAYLEVDNFYSLTVYEKGAEIIRMLHQLVGENGFQKGMRLYFQRHDGQAVTCEDFINAMAESNDRDLSQFKLWYGQSGTPVVTVSDHYDPEQKCYALTFKQHTPPTHDQKQKNNLHIPIQMGLIDEKGHNFAQSLIELTESEQTHYFKQVEAKPTPSLLRHFSAPVKLQYDYATEALIHLLKHDNDPYNRWQSSQKLASQFILADETPSYLYFETLNHILFNRFLSASIKSELLSIPNERSLANDASVIEVAKIVEKRGDLIAMIAKRSQQKWIAMYKKCDQYRHSNHYQQASAYRRLKALALFYLMHVDDQSFAIHAAYDLLNNSPSITDQLNGLKALTYSRDSASKTKALNTFYDRWQHEDLLVNKWLQIQSMAPFYETLANVKQLIDHPAYDESNPNKIHALLSGFTQNFVAFHQKDGSSYQFIRDSIERIDKFNPQTAAKLVRSLMHWQKFANPYADLMKEQLLSLSQCQLSNNVNEIVSKSLQ
jgi:aminopeptidase N